MRPNLIAGRWLDPLAPQGIVVYDRDLRYRVWNRYMEWLTGLAEPLA